MSTIAAQTALNREQLILGHMPQVHLVATRAHRRCPAQVCLEDLVSAGTVGLIQTVDRYDSRRNLKLKTLAEHRIRGAILDYLRELDPLPRGLRQFQHKRDAAYRDLEHRLDRVPCNAELADELGISLSTYRRLGREACAGSPVSLEALIARAGEKAITPADPIGTIDIEDQRERVRAAMQSLPAREQRVLIALLEGTTIRGIARQLRLSQGRASQIKHAALCHIRTALGITSSAHVAGKR